VPSCAPTSPLLLRWCHHPQARLPEYKGLVDDAIAYAKRSGLKGAELMELALDKVS